MAKGTVNPRGESKMVFKSYWIKKQIQPFWLHSSSCDNWTLCL